MTIPTQPSETSTSLNNFNLGRWSSSGSDRAITHFFTAQEIQSREWEKKNKEPTRAWVNSSARRVILWHCIPCASVVCISSEISPHPNWPSLTASGPYLTPTVLFCCPVSTGHCASVSPFANSSLSLSLSGVPLPTYGRVRDPLTGFAPKQTKR